ncbi:MAG: hypothetical protein QXF52_08750 [Thermoproteota archaeon]
MTQATATEARNFANYSYLALLVLGALMALGGLSLILWSLSWSWTWYFGAWGMGTLIEGVVLLAIGGFGAFTAFTVWKPKIVDAVNQGRYADAYQVASNPVQLIIGIICSVIPGIMLFLTQQKLALIVGPAPPPPPP